MQHSISNLLRSYENGSLSRRHLIQGLSLLAATAGTASAAELKGNGINHVSLYVSDIARSAEFYKRVLGCTARDQDANAVRLNIGRSHISLRRKSPSAKVDHFAIGVDQFDQESIIAELKARGATPLTEGGDAGLHVLDPDGYPVQISANDPA